MRIQKVQLKEKSYNIIIDSDIINLKILRTQFETFKLDCNWIILSNSKIYKLYGQKLRALLIKINPNTEKILIREGEGAKSLETINEIYTSLIKFKSNRKSVLISLGGGVIGDIGGFVASTFYRGINHIQIPTSLLSMIDSSIGGKTGINLDSGKNLIGTFYQPKLVLIGVSFLSTLNDREQICGLGEMVKYGLIMDNSFFHKILKLHSDNSWLEDDKIADLIYQCCSMKAAIIEQDEIEYGLRKTLNFGHTVGHALENYYNYQYLNHGEAVIFGMIVETKLSQLLGYLNLNKANVIIKFLKGIKTPILKLENHNKLIKIMIHDKKNIKENKICFILLKSIGETVEYNLDLRTQNEILVEALKAI